MRLLLTIIIIAVGGFFAQWFGPWWSAAFVACLVGVFCGLSTGEAFLAGFWGIALLWLAYALWLDIPSGHALSKKMSEVFKLPSYLLYIIITFLLGGIAGGLPAWAGAHMRRLFQPSRTGESAQS